MPEQARGIKLGHEKESVIEKEEPCNNDSSCKETFEVGKENLSKVFQRKKKKA